MSEPMEYTVPVKIRYVGYDTVRYALASADTVLPMHIGSSGYVAFLMCIREPSPEVEVRIKRSGQKCRRHQGGELQH